MASRSLIDTTEYQDEMVSRRRKVLARAMWDPSILSTSYRKKEEITSHWNLFQVVAKLGFVDKMKPLNNELWCLKKMAS